MIEKIHPRWAANALLLPYAICVALLALASAGCSSSAATTPGAAAPVFERKEVKGLGDPEVVVVNMANRAITVTLSGPTSEVLTIPARSTARRVVPKGAYHYHAQTKGATPFDGDQSFEPDGRYTWSFVIVRSKPAPSETLVAELRRVLGNGRLATARFEGASIGESSSRVPPNGARDGTWLDYPSGWGVAVEGGRIAAFRFGPNVLSDLQLFERADLEALLGRPSSTKPMSTPRGTATILAYDALHAAFLVNDKNEVILLILA